MDSDCCATPAEAGSALVRAIDIATAADGAPPGRDRWAGIAGPGPPGLRQET